MGNMKLTAAPSMLAVFEGFALTLMALFLYAALKYHSGWGGVAVMVVVALLIFAWWRSFSVQIRERALVYTSLFSKKREIKLENIKAISRKIEYPPASGRPPNRLEIYGEVDGRPVAFDINMKVFDLHDGRELEAALISATEKLVSESTFRESAL
jgi:high-affinity Fe2+/Pb2+ permease